MKKYFQNLEKTTYNFLTGRVTSKQFLDFLIKNWKPNIKLTAILNKEYNTGYSLWFLKHRTVVFSVIPEDINIIGIGLDFNIRNYDEQKILKKFCEIQCYALTNMQETIQTLYRIQKLANAIPEILPIFPKISLKFKIVKQYKEVKIEYTECEYRLIFKNKEFINDEVPRRIIKELKKYF